MRSRMSLVILHQYSALSEAFNWRQGRSSTYPIIRTMLSSLFESLPFSFGIRFGNLSQRLIVAIPNYRSVADQTAESGGTIINPAAEWEDS